MTGTTRASGTAAEPIAGERELDIRHDRSSRRIETVVEGHRGWLAYELAADRLIITHTVVPEAIGGRGIAAALTEAVLAYARAAGLKVVPRCSYAAHYLSTHPEHADLLSGPV